MDSFYEYKGYYIEYDLYGQGEYSVQYCGDDYLFKTEEEARDFIDDIVGTGVTAAQFQRFLNGVFCGDASQEFFDKQNGEGYWYFTKHGVMPGSVPRGLDILDVVDTAEGTYFLTNRVITTDALRRYEIKEKRPR